MPAIPKESEYVLHIRATSGSRTQEVPVHLGIDNDWLDCVTNGPRGAMVVADQVTR